MKPGPKTPICGILTLLCAAAAISAAPLPAAPTPLPPPCAAERALFESEVLRLDWTDPARQRKVPVKIYLPSGAAAANAGAQPVVIFSHGLGGTREAYEYLARQWAANGYVSVHLQHAGSDDSAWRGQERPMQSMREAASFQNSVDRARDVSFALDRLESLNATDATLKGKLDLSNVGVAGHSFGAQTTLLVAGQRMGPSRPGAATAGDFTDPRIKAAIPMSAPVPALRTDLDAVYANVKIPTFHMTGTKDDSPIGDTKATDRRIPFDHIKNNTCLLTFTNGDHMVFSGRLAPRPNDLEFQKLILLASTAFWDAHLKADPAAKKWIGDENGGLKSALDANGTLERK